MNRTAHMLGLSTVLLLAACDKTQPEPPPPPPPPPVVQPPAPSEPIFPTSAVGPITANCSYANAQLGKEEMQDAITLYIKVGNTGSDQKEATYTPPAGWVVVSHQLIELSKFGNVSYDVSTFPAGWNYSSQENVASTYWALIDAAAQKGWTKYAGKLKIEQSETSAYFNEVKSSHHALRLRASAKGRGPFQGGSAANLLVKAKLRYTGVDNLLEGLKACHQKQLGL